MKNSILLIICAFTFITAHSQVRKTVTYYDFRRTQIKEVYYTDLSTGFRIGKWIQYKDGFQGILATGNYNQGYKAGKWVYNWPYVNDNVPLLIETFNDKGQYHGEYYGRECITCRVSRGMYVNGLKEGKWTYNFPEDASKVREVSYYKHGELDGESIEYYFSGKIKSKAVCRDGNVISEVQYDEEGNIVE